MSEVPQNDSNDNFDTENERYSEGSSYTPPKDESPPKPPKEGFSKKLAKVFDSSFSSLKIASNLAYCSACVAITLCIVGVAIGVEYSALLGIFAVTNVIIGHICGRMVNKIYKQNSRSLMTEL